MKSANVCIRKILYNTLVPLSFGEGIGGEVFSHKQSFSEREDKVLALILKGQMIFPHFFNLKFQIA